MLFESASGFALFDIKGLDEIGQAVDKVQASVSDMQRFGKVAKLTAFKPFASAADALEQINAVSEANLTDDLKNFITVNLPKVGNSSDSLWLGSFPHACRAGVWRSPVFQISSGLGSSALGAVQL